MNADKDNAGTQEEFSVGQGSDYFRNKIKYRSPNLGLEITYPVLSKALWQPECPSSDPKVQFKWM